MKKGYIALAVAVLAIVAGLLYVTNRNAVNRGGVTVVTRANVQQVVLGSDRPVIMLVTAQGCADCPAVLEALKKEVANHKDVRFAVVDANEIGAPAQMAPAIISVLPGVGVTTQKANITAADVPAYIAKRADIGGKQMAAVKKLSALEKEIATKGKPFDDELAALETKAVDALKPIEAKAEAAAAQFKPEAEALQKKMEAAVGTLKQDLEKAVADQNRAEYDRIRAEIAVKVEPFRAEAEALQAKIAAAVAPFEAEAEAALAPIQAEAEKVAQRRSQALGNLETDAQAAQMELMQLVMADKFGDMLEQQPADPADGAKK